MIRMQVKNYEIKGKAKFNTDRFPTEQPFTKYVRALNEREALEKVYSTLGGKNKIRRDEMIITSIKEVPEDQIGDKRIADLTKLEKII